MAEFDIKAIIEKLTSKFNVDASAIGAFFKDPVKTIESITGKDLPDEKVREVIDGIKAKISGGELKLPDGLSLDSLKNVIGGDSSDADGLLGKVKNIFGKK